MYEDVETYVQKQLLGAVLGDAEAEESSETEE